MAPIPRVVAPGVAYAAPDVDTDQIIPARFLTTTRRDGLAAAAFCDVRDVEGFPREAFARGAPFVLFTGPNFGCGSSREHAVWALQQAGVQAVVGPGFGDIFRRNAAANGLVVATVDAASALTLREAVGRRPGATVVVDLEACRVAVGDVTATFDIDPFARRCHLEGVDELGFLLARAPLARAFEARHTLGPKTRVEGRADA